MSDILQVNPLPETIYTIVEYYDYRKEVYIAGQGFSTDKEKACQHAATLSQQNGSKYTDNCIVLDILKRPDLLDDSYVECEERSNGKVVAIYSCFECSDEINEDVAKEEFSLCEFEEGKVVTLRDLVLRISSKDEEGSEYKEVASKFDMTHIVGEHQTCSNMELVSAVLKCMLMVPHSSLTERYTISSVSGIRFAVIEIKAI